jgi:hypothetical protein
MISVPTILAHEPLTGGTAGRISALWDDGWMEDNPLIPPASMAEEIIVFNYDDNTNVMYYLGSDDL